MELKFAGMGTYTSELFYHRLAAQRGDRSISENQNRFPVQKLIRYAFPFAAAFVVFYLFWPAADTPERLFGSFLAAVLAAVITGRSRRNEKRTKKSGETAAGTSGEGTAEEETLRRNADALLENSCLSGEKYQVRFFEDGFELENGGIKAWYEYEGIAWIKETSKYFLIFWNASYVIPVEKAGLFHGTVAGLGDFLEKKCGKTIAAVRG